MNMYDQTIQTPVERNHRGGDSVRSASGGLMPADISPLLELVSLEHTDILTMMAIIAPASVATVIWLTHHRVHKQQLNEQKRQTDINDRQTTLDSARLVLELMKPLQDHKMQKLISWLSSNQPDPPWDEDVLQRFLNHMDLIAMYHYHELLAWSHVYGQYGGTFSLIGKQVQVKEFMDRNYNPYLSLRRMINQIQDAEKPV